MIVWRARKRPPIELGGLEMRKMIAESVTYDHMTGDTTKVTCYEEPTCIGWHYEVSVETETSFTSRSLTIWEVPWSTCAMRAAL